MTKVLVDRIETQQDELRFGDPIGCHYHWTEPAEVDRYGDSVRHLANKVELAVDGFERTAGLSEEVFAGEAADTLRERAGTRHEESATVRDNLRGLGRAINAYSDVLARHREGLQQLRSYAASKGLEVRDNRIWPPVETIAGDAPEKEMDAWERDWKTYQECFDTKIELRDARRASTRELVKALADHAGVHPDKDKQKLVAANAHQVKFGELRREAADEATGGRPRPRRRRRGPPHGRRAQAARAGRARRPREDGPRGEVAGGDPGPVRQGAGAAPRAGRGPRRGPRRRGRR